MTTLAASPLVESSTSPETVPARDRPEPSARPDRPSGAPVRGSRLAALVAVWLAVTLACVALVLYEVEPIFQQRTQHALLTQYRAEISHAHFITQGLAPTQVSTAAPSLGSPVARPGDPRAAPAPGGGRRGELGPDRRRARTRARHGRPRPAGQQCGGRAALDLRRSVPRPRDPARRGPDAGHHHPGPDRLPGLLGQAGDDHRPRGRPLHAGFGRVGFGARRPCTPPRPTPS